MKQRIRYSLLFFILTGLIISCDKKEELQIRELTGNWIWKSSCGGFAGTCSYPDEENYKSIQITDGNFIKVINGIVTIDKPYEITNTWVSETNYPYEVDYELTLEDGTVLDMILLKNKNKLAIGNNLFVDYYEGI